METAKIARRIMSGESENENAAVLIESDAEMDDLECD